ncbi:zinc finger protein 346 isoform X1 [Onychostoma macrolepis]|uniref:zinc finger protein 346 isoform X1 n=2 Tax=Onychostoma macrolepis TaxID=369639 RepID=UPI00272D9A81|nr:zinc finger protein 346 isoform X1 [Onychostoma macrolepis]XP_058613846.1 zinc finger protein 346 isoform X1 [Onychostoma macrolepis]
MKRLVQRMYRLRMRDPPPANIMAQQEPNGDFPYLPSGAAEVNRMIKEHSDLFSDSQCKVCSAVLISESQKLAHYQSKKHESKVRRYMSIHSNEEPIAKRFKPSGDCYVLQTINVDEGDKYKACNVCNMTFSSPVVAQSHYQGKVHSKNLRLKTFGQQTPALPQPKAQVKKDEGLPEGGQGPAKRDPNRFCSICQASFNNPLMAQQHYNGKKHKKHLTKQKLMETYGPSSAPASTLKGYPCTVCNIELNSVEQYQAHISGSKHKNHVKLKKGPNVFPGPPENYQPDFQYPPNQEGPEDVGDWDSFNEGYE